MNDVAGDGTTTALLLTTEAVVCLKPKERQGSKAEQPEDEDWD
jgi:chaperonin GroEL (HSP60 family)